MARTKKVVITEFGDESKLASIDKLVIQIRVLLHLHSQRAEAVILESTAHGSFQKRVRLFYHGLNHRSLIQTE
jgi:hypothetical protein